jgi:MFS family permease
LNSDPVGAQPTSAGYLTGSSLYPWFLVLMLTVLYTSSYIDRQILGLLVKPIRADLHITDTEYSYLSGFAFVTMYSIVGIPLGWAVDRWNRRAIIVVGVSVWSLMTAGCGLAGSFVRLFALRVGVGIGEATLSPASYSLISDYFPPGKLSRALSVYGLGIPIGTGLALVIGGSVVQAFERLGPLDLPLLGSTKPWQTVFLAIGLPGLLLAGVAALVIREPSRRRLEGGQGNRPAPSIAEAAIFMWQNRSIYLSLSFGLGLLVVYAYGAAAWYPAFLQRVHGFSIADAGLFLGTTNVVFGILGSVTAGFLADKLIARGHSDGQFIVPMIYAVGVTVCGVGAGLAPAPWLSLTCVALSSFFANTTLGCVAAAVQVVTPRRMRGQMSAFFLFVAAFVGIAVGPTAVAASTDYIFGYDGAVGYSLALVALVFPALGALTLHLGRRAMHERVVRSRAAESDGDRIGLVPPGYSRAR